MCMEDLEVLVSEVTSKKSPVRVEMIGMQDTFGESGTPNELLAKYGLNVDHIVEKVKECL